MSVPDELSLNDRLGGSLCQAAVFLERDDREVDVFKAEGELRLRSREHVSSREHLPLEDDLSGIYTSAGHARLERCAAASRGVWPPDRWPTHG